MSFVISRNSKQRFMQFSGLDCKNCHMSLPVDMFRVQLLSTALQKNSFKLGESICINSLRAGRNKKFLFDLKDLSESSSK